MSSYFKPTKHPETGEVQDAFWIDDWFGRHLYGVKFPDGKVFRTCQIDDSASAPAVPDADAGGSPPDAVAGADNHGKYNLTE